MRNYRAGTALVTAGLLISGAGWAADQPAPAKPTLPSVSDLLDASGITATGWISGTFDVQTASVSTGTAPKDYDAFTLQQAGFTLAKQPSSGFGGLVNVIAGQSIYMPNYSPYGYGSAGVTGTSVQLAQAYAQYAYGSLTLIAGKYVTLAGAEVLASPGNTNITRSLLYAYEPVTHTGARLTWAVDSTFSFIVGVNNGWIYSDESPKVNSKGDAVNGKTVEIGLAWTPSKMFSWTLQGYSGPDVNATGETSGQSLIDTVLTWNATSALTVIGSVDWASVNKAYGPASSSASWWGVAGYLNYAFNDQWRVSLRGEYYDDTDGYLTLFALNNPRNPVGQKLYEGTVTFGYAPAKNFELRLEARYDDYQGQTAVLQPAVKVTQGWVEALYHF